MTEPALLVSASKDDSTRLVDNGPRRDFIELSRAVNGRTVYQRGGRRVRGWRSRLFGPHMPQAWKSAWEAQKGQSLFADGEHSGLPLATFLGLLRRDCSLTFIAHLPSKPWKRALFWLASRVFRRGTVVVHSQIQYDTVQRVLHRDWNLELVPYQVDTRYWRRDDPEAQRLVVAVGAEHRDYETLLRAEGSLAEGIRVVIAAGSHWARSGFRELATPESVTLITEPLSFHSLRCLYAQAAVVVVPLRNVANQSGVTTILEAMSMSRPVVLTATDGQREYVKGPLMMADGRMDLAATADRGPVPRGGDRDTDPWGVYTPPGDAEALARAITRIIDDQDYAQALGHAGRVAACKHFSIELYVARIASLLRTGDSQPTNEGVRVP